MRIDCIDTINITYRQRKLDTPNYSANYAFRASRACIDNGG